MLSYYHVHSGFRIESTYELFVIFPHISAAFAFDLFQISSLQLMFWMICYIAKDPRWVNSTRNCY